MKKIIFILLLLLPSFCFGAIDTASVNEGMFTLSGSGFGSVTLSNEWVGQNIEAGTTGTTFSKSRWSVDAQSTARQASEYSTELAHSGTKSIKSSYPISTQFTSGYWYTHDITFTKIYATWWAYFDHVDTEAQWKMWRLRPITGVPYGDENGEIMSSQWYSSEGANSMNYVIPICNLPTLTTCAPGGQIYGPAENLVTPRQWVRFEVYAEENSAPNATDGKLYYTITRNGETTHVQKDWPNLCTRIDGALDWQQFVFENYWGNVGTGPGTNEKIYIDDIYLQFGSRARVEIGDDPVYANCTHREIQPAATWSDTGITGTLNIGSFSPTATVYFFVVDEDGVASAGKEVALGGTPTYNPPTITAPSDFSTTSSSVDIEGTYTADPDLADQSVVVTWINGENSGFGVAALGVFSCTVPVELGTNSIVFEITDSNSGTDSDTTVVTRTAPPISSTSTTHGYGVLKNTTIH